jgi:hypothetical protein
MYRCTAHFDGDKGIEHPYGCFEGCQVGIFIREDPEVAIVHSNADTCGDILLRGLEPSVSLSLRVGNV